MRKLPLLLALLLLALLASAIPTQAALLPEADPLTPLVAPEADEEEAEAEESDAGEEADEEEACDFEEEDCEEEAEQGGKGKAKKDDPCLLKSATAAVSVNPGKRRLRLVVHYRTTRPASVSIEALLRGVKGAVYLGTSHTRFRRSGVYRDTYELAQKETKRALAAREVSVDLQALNTPASCRLHLTESVRRPKH